MYYYVIFRCGTRMALHDINKKGVEIGERQNDK